MSSPVLALVVAISYMALAKLSSLLTHEATDAWSVWLATPLTLGVLLVVARARWLPVLIGAALGAALFSWVIDPGKIAWAGGYAGIEVLSVLAGAWAAHQVAPIPLTLERPREVAALIVGAMAMALVGGALGAAWTAVAGGAGVLATFYVWALANFVGALLIAPVVVTWAGFRAKRSGGLTMPQFVGGAIACVLFLGSLQLLFGPGTNGRLSGSVGMTLTYPPILFAAVIALTWGTRGATLAALGGALIALVNTSHGNGPFAAVEGFVGEANLEVQGYAAAVALTGLLIAGLAARQRGLWREARDWRTRFEAAIGAHRLLAYEWDPVSGAFAVTGETTALVGVPPARIATLADWLSHVAGDERDAMQTAFALRADGGAMPALRYRVQRPDGTAVAMLDEAQAIRDHDGSLHRVTGIVRLS
ncbi:MAG: MASE1 domain-containing protein [Casimicrobiaceae bacterium]